MSKISEFINKSEAELKDLIIGYKRESLNLSFQRVNGQLTNPSRFRIVRRNIARIKTILTQNKNKIG